MYTHTLFMFCKGKSCVKRFVFPSGWQRGALQSAFPRQDTTVSDALSPLSFCFWCSLYSGKIMGAQEAKALSLLSPSRSYCQN